MITFKYEFKIVANGVPRIFEVENRCKGWGLSVWGLDYKEIGNKKIKDLIKIITNISKSEKKTFIPIDSTKMVDIRSSINDKMLLGVQQTCIELENLIKDLKNDKLLNDFLLLNDFINENYNFENNYVVIAAIRHLLSEGFKITNIKDVLDKLEARHLEYDVWDIDFGGKMSFTVGEYGRCEKYAIDYLEQNAEELMGTQDVPSHIKNYIDTERWVNDAISEGLGNCLSGYDGWENHEVVDGTDYYIYRTN